MHILVLNSGSSSIKFSMFDSGALDRPEARPLFHGELSGVGGAQARLELKSADAALTRSSPVDAANTTAAGRIVLDEVSKPGMPAIEAIGYRVVHPGPKLNDHVKITPEVLDDIEDAVRFAPLHDPAVVAVIREARTRFPGIGHFACFDTVFHQSMPEEASIYPIPLAYREQGVRRYGFHGLSCESVIAQLEAAGQALPRRMVIAHLGSGCSVTALAEGHSVDTTMGLTPTGGVVMGTRPGDLDPGLILYLLRQQGAGGDPAISALETLLNHQAGLVALSGLPNDVKAMREAASKRDPHALLALKVFTRSIRKAVGAFSWLLGGLDTIVFTGGIGEHDPATRIEVLEALRDLGIVLDPARNQETASGLRAISASPSRTTVLVIPAQEDLTIARHVARMARAEPT